MGRDVVHSALLVLGVALGLSALFNVGGGIGVWWGLSAFNAHGRILVAVAVGVAVAWAIRRRM